MVLTGAFHEDGSAKSAEVEQNVRRSDHRQDMVYEDGSM